MVKRLYLIMGHWLTAQQKRRLDRYRTEHNLSLLPVDLSTSNTEAHTSISDDNKILDELKTLAYTPPPGEERRRGRRFNREKTYLPGQFYRESVRRDTSSPASSRSTPSLLYSISSPPPVRSPTPLHISHPWLDMVLPGHAGKILNWPDGTRSNAPYAVLEASQYGIAANHLHNDEVFAEKMTHLEHARGSSRFAFINGASRRPSAISLDVLSNLSEGRVVVVENLPKGDLPLDAQLIQDTLHIRTNFTVDVTDAVLRTYPEHAREPFRRLSVADMARLAQDVRSPPLAILDLHAPIQQYNPLLEFVSDCHETLKSPAGNVYNSVGVLRGTNRLSQWAVFNSGPHVTPLHHDASAFATSFQVHADCAKFWGICLLDSSTVQSLGELCDIYTTVVEQEDITFDTPEAERRGVRFYVLDVRAGVTVFTNPGTIHFVYTPKATVMTGGHFMSVDLAHFVEFGRFRERREEQLREKRRKAAQEAGVEIDDDDGSHGAIGFMEDDIYAQDLLVQAMLCLHAHLRPIRRKPLISLCRMVAYPLQYLPAVPEGKNAAGEEPSRHRQYWNQKSHRVHDSLAHDRAMRVLSFVEGEGFDTSVDHLLAGGCLEDVGDLYSLESLPLAK